MYASIPTILLTCLCLLPPAEPPPHETGPGQPVIEAAVHIEAAEYYGSGTLIKAGDEVLVLTAAHLVEDNMIPRNYEYINEKGKSVGVDDKTPIPLKGELMNGRRLTLDPVWYSPNYQKGGPDLALLKPRGCTRDLRPLEVGDPDRVWPGDDAWYCGSGGGLKFSLERTIFNRRLGPDWVVNGNVWFGHSGSGVCVRGCYGTFRVVAVVSRPAYNGPKTPALCETRILPFLAAYQASKKRPCPTCGVEYMPYCKK